MLHDGLFSVCADEKKEMKNKRMSKYFLTNRLFW